MENQIRKYNASLTLAFILLLILMFASSFIINNTSRNCAFFIVSCSFVTFLIISRLRFNKICKKYQMEEAKNKLNSEFIEILLRDSSVIPKEMFKCEAKVDSNGQIVCKINFNFEIRLNSYDEFVKIFCFNQSEY